MSNSNRSVSITTPLGDEELIFQSFTGTEEMGRLFEFEVELIREQNKGTVTVKDLLGKDMTLALDMPDTTTRYFNGAITQFKHTGFDDGVYRYRAVLRPWLWFLTRTANCRIFQEKDIPDIVKEILGEHSYIDVEYKTEGTYDTLDYCVQYRETDFEFISRLMEHAGIFYYFKHESDKHIMVITDNGSSYQSVTDYTTIPYFPPGNTAARERDHISEWLNGHQVQSGAFEINDFDFESPSSDLTAKSTKSQSHTYDSLEIYDYPGKYTEASSGTTRTDILIEEAHSQYSLASGQGNAMGIQTGMEFTLSDFYFDEENTKHVVISASYVIQGDSIASSGGNGSLFEVNFIALNSEQQFRPQRITPKPVISGSQTAIVVGKEGEEIWTDKYGRVKVQFHWDRVGENDENSSCWVRVSYPTAGKNWGWVSLPRMDQEVIVSFLEGDPDRPMITGRVYNAEQMPPYDLPTNQTQSGIKTQSSKEGTAKNFNEIRFEDKIGEEELYIHAEKDCNRVVENSDTLKVGYNDDGDHDSDEGNQTIDIYNDRAITLEEGSDSLTIEKGDRNTTVEEGDYTVDIDTGKRTINVKDNDATTVSSGDHSLDISSGKSTMEAAVSIELIVGSNSIKIDQSGITIKGIAISIEGSATAEMKSPMTTVKGDGMLTLKGGMTMIN
ncbi:MAG: type VI secretion system tip protein VgrG [Methylococcaceae bacterium]|nr:type VI secretion system tip protein VgrG [Methylococcaceae bacterium]